MYNLLTKINIMINSINVSEKTNEELIKDLEAKKAEAVASDDFEEAIKIRDQIKELKSKEITKESESNVSEKADQIEVNAEEHRKDMDAMKVKANEEKQDKINDLM
jgi:excinuclease UvrABC nuclease subunit